MSLGRSDLALNSETKWFIQTNRKPSHRGVKIGRGSNDALGIRWVGLLTVRLSLAVGGPKVPISTTQGRLGWSPSRRRSGPLIPIRVVMSQEPDISLPRSPASALAPRLRRPLSGSLLTDTLPPSRRPRDGFGCGDVEDVKRLHRRVWISPRPLVPSPGRRPAQGFFRMG